MTREEIIRNLKYTMEKHKNDTVDTFGTNISVMCKDILEYLEQEPSGDLISRKVLISHIENQSRKWGEDYDAQQILGDIEDLPSVKPQESCDVPDTNVGDIISKQTVLDTISELNAISFYEAQEDSKECYYEIRQAIEDLPPVKQEPQTGHWINIGLEGKIVEQIVQSFTCSECGAISVFRMTGGKIVNGDLCPNCGAKMVEPQERSE